MNPASLASGGSPVSFWLVLAEADQLQWAPLINQLADEFNAPRFAPHITLLATQLAHDESPRQIMTTAAQGISPITFKSRTLEHGPEFFKSVFIQLNNEQIVPLNAALLGACRHPSNYQVDAHMSILYQRLSAEQRLSLISSLQLPPGPIHFDSLVTVVPGVGQTNFDDVRKWQCAAKIKLT